MRHIAQPIFLWDMKATTMIIFERRLCHARVHVCFALTVGACYRVFARIVVATVVGIVMVVVVHVVCTLNVLVVVVVAHEIFFACFVIDSTFIAGDPGRELARYA